LRYTILSIDESREEKKKEIRRILSEWEEFKIDCVNGHKIEEITAARMLTSVPHFPMLPGELGVWYSVVKSWIDVINNGPAVVFEDDALLEEGFPLIFEEAVSDLPDDADFLSLFIPYNQVQDYSYLVEYDKEGNPKIFATGVPEKYSMFKTDSKYLAKSYQGYGNVCMYYTQSGAQKLLRIAREMGTYTPIDCFIFMQANKGLLNGYSLHPDYYGLVDVDWEAPTLIHDGWTMTEE